SQLGVQIRGFRYVGELFPKSGRIFLQGATVEADLSLCRGEETENLFDGGTFAGPVQADQSHDFTRFYGERKIVNHRLSGGIATSQCFYFQQRRTLTF